MFFSAIDVILFFFWLVVLLFIIKAHSFFRIPELGKRFLSGVFVLKVAAGTVLAALYTYYYTDRSTADIYKYFDDSKYMTAALWSQPGDFFRMLLGFDNDNEYFNTHYYNQMNNWFRSYESNLYNDSHTIIRINAVMRIFSLGSYPVHTLFACFFSLAGLVGIYKAFVSFFKGKEQWLAIVVFLIPSVLFWGSGVLKEAFLLCGLGLFFYSLMQILQTEMRLKNALFLVAGFVLLLYLKVYVLMALLPGLVAFIWIAKTKHKYILLKYFVVLLVSAVLWVYFEKLFPQYHMLEILVQKQQDFNRLSESMNSGSLIPVFPLQADFISFLKASPFALFNVLFRPFPGESFSPFILMASLENLIFIVSILVAVFRFENITVEKSNLFIFLLLYVGLLFVLIGWVTPVMGAIVRYKVPALPFLGMLLLLITRSTNLRLFAYMFR